MTTRKAIATYLAELKKTASSRKFQRQQDCLELFLDYLTDYTNCRNSQELGAEHLREFLGYWYIRKITQSASHALDCLRSIKQFFKWLDQKEGSSLSFECKEDFLRFSQDLPRVFKVMDALSDYDLKQSLLNEPFFQKFFADQKEKIKEILNLQDSEEIKFFDTQDIDYDHLCEGYFEITAIRSEGVEVTPYDATGEEPIFPVKFPKKAVPWLKKGYLINLSLAPSNKTGYWKILEHGFVYPG